MSPPSSRRRRARARRPRTRSRWRRGPRVDADDVEAVGEGVGQDGRHADGEVGRGAAGPARVDEQGADAVVLAAGEGAGEAEREGVACRVVVVDRDLEGAAVGGRSPPTRSCPRRRRRAVGVAVVASGRHARQVIVGRCGSPPLPARTRPRRGRAGRSGCGEAQVAAEHPLTAGSTPVVGAVNLRCRHARPASTRARSSPIRGSPPPSRPT